MECLDFHHHNKEKTNGIFNLNIEEEVPFSFFSVGLHPRDITNSYPDVLGKVVELAQNPYCWAIGECGLDSLVEVDEPLQEEVFRQQILLANQLDKPVVVHCVRRFSQVLKFQKVAKIPLIIHGFNKKENIAQELLSKGFYLSLGSSLLYNRTLQETAKKLPLDKIFLETDTANVEIMDIYCQFAQIKGLPLDELSERIFQNWEKVFGKQLML